MRGAVIKQYQVWGKLSEGGMSEVWLARHADLAVPVIIKTLFAGTQIAFETRYARMLTEARLSARLSSPRVVRVVDAGVYTPPDSTLESVPFLVEEYVDGIDMAEFERRRRNALHRPLPLWCVSDMIAQAAEGLHAAHQAGVIHCDVKPSNLFGHGHGDIKVGDFGVAVASATEHSPPAGTPLYMAPEQLLGEPITRRADVYALGATAFTMRYGFTPFDAMAAAVRSDASPRFPPAKSPDEAYFQNVVARMMARRADARYPNMTVPRRHLRALTRATMPRLITARIAPDRFQVGDAVVSIEVGDLSRIETDAVVNSASSSMRMRGSLSDALRVRGGDAIENEAMSGGERALGECVATGPGTLPCRGVLHAVGGWNEVSCVARATHRALLLAEERGFARIAFPAIATGRTGVTVESCADAMMAALRTHISLGGSQLREVRFVLVDGAVHRRFHEVGSALLLGDEEAAPHDDSVDAPVTHEEATSGPTMFVSNAPATRTPTIRMDDEPE